MFPGSFSQRLRVTRQRGNQKRAMCSTTDRIGRTTEKPHLCRSSRKITKTDGLCCWTLKRRNSRPSLTGNTTMRGLEVLVFADLDFHPASDGCRIQNGFFFNPKKMDGRTCI